MKKLSLIVILLVSAAAAGYVIFLSYSTVNPLGGVRLIYNEVNIKEKADSLLNSLGINVENAEKIVNLQTDKPLITSLYKEYHFSEASNLLREKVPGYYWEVEWGKSESGVVISNDEKKKSHTSGNVTFDFDTRGNLIKFKKVVNDSLKYTTVPEADAKNIALKFISDFAPVKVVDSSSGSAMYRIKGSFRELHTQKTEMQNRTEYKFGWEAESLDLNKILSIYTVVSGNFVTEYNLSFKIPENTDNHSDTFEMLASLPFYIIIYILIIVFGYKRIRAYEVSFRLAIIMGVIVGLLFSINLYTMIADSAEGWDLWLPLIFSAVFFAIGIIITWSVSETIAREAWKEKFISIDLLTKGYLFHSKVGSAGIIGLSGGFIIFIIWSGLLYISENLFHIWFVLSDNSSLISHFSSVSPALSILDKNIYPQIFYGAIFILFVFSGLKRRFNSLYILIPLVAALWGIVNFNNIFPVYWGVITGIIISALFLLVFRYFDILTALIAMTAYNILDSGGSLFTSGNLFYVHSGYYLIAVFFVLIIFLIAGLFTKDKITDYDSITPAFVKNITERQRLQRELEIARDVQMSFLPAREPQFQGLDITAHCIPAKEVGGDYYDFVKLNENRFGIIIGDVSGKGTQAAFYMTLAKGFVKALSKTINSPSEFLIKINELFYENVERGTFISMIYGIFDTKEKTLTFARAGHNPVIAKHSGNNQVEMLNPVGLALGLEKGIIFSKTIREINVSINPGDTFVFYTDGFTEAMNKYKIEFTEERLKETISNNIDLSAKDLLEKTITEVKNFMGKAVQHDDMTMVVVKVRDKTI